MTLFETIELDIRREYDKHGLWETKDRYAEIESIINRWSNYELLRKISVYLEERENKK